MLGILSRQNGTKSPAKGSKQVDTIIEIEKGKYISLPYKEKEQKFKGSLMCEVLSNSNS